MFKRDEDLKRESAYIKVQTHCDCVVQFDLAVTGAVNCGNNGSLSILYF